MLKKIFFIILIILFVGLRLYKIDAPIADWHSWRQVDTAAVARNYVKDSIDVLHPRYDDLSNIQTGFDNLEGYRMVEFPLYQATGAVFKMFFPQLSIELWMRIIAIMCALFSMILIVLITRIIADEKIALIAGILYTILPYNIYYNRAILPENMAIFYVLLSIFTYLKYLDNKSSQYKIIWFLISSISAAISILIKPTAGFMLIPIAYLMLINFTFTKKWILTLVAYAVISIFPFWWWRVWITQFPEGVPVYQWLFNGGNIRFKGAWFYWLFAERISKLILGYWGVFLLMLGMNNLTNTKKYYWFSKIWFMGVVIYFTVIARGNVQHDYYQIVIIPALSLLLGEGSVYMFRNFKSPFIIKIFNLILVVAFMIGFSWYNIRTYYWINRPEIVAAGQMADKLLPKDALVIAPYNGDTTFLYQTGRRGWPIGFDIPKKISMGATHYVTVSPTDNDTETKELAQKYKVLVRNSDFAIIDLTRMHDE